MRRRWNWNNINKTLNGSIVACRLFKRFGHGRNFWRHTRREYVLFTNLTQGLCIQANKGSTYLLNCEQISEQAKNVRCCRLIRMKQYSITKPTHETKHKAVNNKIVTFNLSVSDNCTIPLHRLSLCEGVTNEMFSHALTSNEPNVNGMWVKKKTDPQIYWAKNRCISSEN